MSRTIACFAVTILPSFVSIGGIAERFYIVRIGMGALIVIYISSSSFQISKMSIVTKWLRQVNGIKYFSQMSTYHLARRNIEIT